MEKTFHCFLSDLDAPISRKTRDHYCPRSLVSKRIWNDPRNIHDAHATINQIKGARMPCDWVDLRIDLAYHALLHWNLKTADALFVQRAIDQWEAYTTDPCKYCLMNCKGK